MTKINHTIILSNTTSLFARSGSEFFSIRKLAKQIGVAPSVIYHYYKSEDELLRSMFDFLNHELGVRRAELPKVRSAKRMLKQRIEFQLDNQEEIVAVLKYYLAFRSNFPRYKNGFLPDKSALHIEEVLRFGVKTGEFNLDKLEDDAKVITHAINGFLLEYYPYLPQGKERKVLIDLIYKFLVRSLSKGGETE